MKMDYLQKFDSRTGIIGCFDHFIHFFPTKNKEYGSYRLFGFEGVKVSELIRDSSKIECHGGDPNWIPIFVDLDAYLIQKDITIEEIDRQKQIYCECPKNENLEQRIQREGRVIEFFTPILQYLVEEKGHNPEFLFA